MALPNGIYAQIVNNAITNIVVCNASFAGANGLTQIDNLSPVPGVGWTVSGSVWSPPLVPVTTQNQTTLQQRGLTALTNNQTYLAIGSPTNAQAVAQVGALTRQVDGIIRLLLGQLQSIADS